MRAIYFKLALALILLVILISIPVFAQAAADTETENIPLGFTLDFSDSNVQFISLPLPKDSNFSSFKFVINASEVDYVDYLIAGSFTVPPHSQNYADCSNKDWLSTDQKYDNGACYFADLAVDVDMDISKITSAEIISVGSFSSKEVSSVNVNYFLNKECTTTDDGECASWSYGNNQAGGTCSGCQSRRCGPPDLSQCQWPSGPTVSIESRWCGFYGCMWTGSRCNSWKSYTTYHCNYPYSGSMTIRAGDTTRQGGYNDTAEGGKYDPGTYYGWSDLQSSIDKTKLKQGKNIFSFSYFIADKANVQLYDTTLRLFAKGIYPKDFKVDIGDDGSYDYTLLGEIKGQKIVEVPAEKVNALLQNCEADADGFCEVPVSFYLGGAARVELVSLLVEEPVKIELEENQSAVISPFALASGGVDEKNSGGSESGKNNFNASSMLALAALGGAGALGYSYLSRRNLGAQNKNNYLKISAAIAKNKIERENSAIKSIETAAKSAVSSVSNAVESVSNSIKSFASSGFSFSRKSGSFSSSSKSSGVANAVKSAANSVASIFKQSTGNGSTRKNIDNYLLAHKTGAQYASGLLKASGATAFALGALATGVGAVPAGLALAAGGGAAYVAGGAIGMGLERAGKSGTNYTSAPGENIFGQVFGVSDTVGMMEAKWNEIKISSDKNIFSQTLGAGKRTGGSSFTVDNMKKASVVPRGVAGGLPLLASNNNVSLINSLQKAFDEKKNMDEISSIGFGSTSGILKAEYGSPGRILPPKSWKLSSSIKNFVGGNTKIIESGNYPEIIIEDGGSHIHFGADKSGNGEFKSVRPVGGGPRYTEKYPSGTFQILEERPNAEIKFSNMVKRADVGKVASVGLGWTIILPLLLEYGEMKKYGKPKEEALLDAGKGILSGAVALGVSYAIGGAIAGSAVGPIGTAAGVVGGLVAGIVVYYVANAAKPDIDPNWREKAVPKPKGNNIFTQMMYGAKPVPTKSENNSNISSGANKNNVSSGGSNSFAASLPLIAVGNKKSESSQVAGASQKINTVKVEAKKFSSTLATKIQTKFVELNSVAQKAKEAGSGFFDKAKSFVSGKQAQSARPIAYNRDRSEPSNPVVNRASSGSSTSKSSSSSGSSSSKSSGSSSGGSGGFVNTMKSAGSGAVNYVKNVASSAVSTVESVVSSGVSAVKSGLSKLFGK